MHILLCTVCKLEKQHKLDRKELLDTLKSHIVQYSVVRGGKC